MNYIISNSQLTGDFLLKRCHYLHFACRAVDNDCFLIYNGGTKEGSGICILWGL